MTVSNSRLAIDSSLSPNDAKLVRPGATVKIEEPDLGVSATGIVTQVADRPGTHKVDPGRVYVSITPRTAPAQLVGASVKLTIAVKSTEQKVLTVPVTALSVGADGDARVQVQTPGGGSQYVKVTPGLAAQGLVEIRPVSGELAAGRPRGVGYQGWIRGRAGGGRRGDRHIAAGRHEHQPQGLERDLRDIRNVGHIRDIRIFGSVRVHGHVRGVGNLGWHDEQGNLIPGSRFDRGYGQSVSVAEGTG